MRIFTIVLIWLSLCLTVSGAPKNPRKSKSGRSRSGRGRGGGSNRRPKTNAMVNVGRIPVEEDLTLTVVHEDDISTEEQDPVEQLFNFVDINRDGFITLNEYKLNNPDRAEQNFSRLDLNSNRVIDIEELKMSKAPRDPNGDAQELSNGVHTVDLVAGHEQFLERKLHSALAVLDICTTHALMICGRRAFDDLTKEREESENFVANEIVCSGVQQYVSCIGDERKVCAQLGGYAGIIKKTAEVYKNSGLCPQLDLSVFDQPAINVASLRHIATRSLDETILEIIEEEIPTTRRSRPEKSRSMSDRNCIRTSVAECNIELLQIINSDDRPYACEIMIEYRRCIGKVSKHCSRKSHVKKIVNGLKEITREHRTLKMCNLYIPPLLT